MEERLIEREREREREMTEKVGAMNGINSSSLGVGKIGK